MPKTHCLFHSPVYQSRILHMMTHCWWMMPLTRFNHGEEQEMCKAIMGPAIFWISMFALYVASFWLPAKDIFEVSFGWPVLGVVTVSSLVGIIKSEMLIPTVLIIVSTIALGVQSWLAGLQIVIVPFALAAIIIIVSEFQMFVSFCKENSHKRTNT